MIRILIACLVALIFCGCTDRISELPDCWEYSHGKWISFNDTIELNWKYKNHDDVSFQVSRVNIKLTADDIKEIKKLIKKDDIEGLVSKEYRLRLKANFKDMGKNSKTVHGLIFKDQIEPILTFSNMMVYNIKAVKKNKISNPAVLSVCFIDRSK